jgi:exodeoxyribonuclease III
MSLKIVTWNVNSIAARLERAKAFVLRENPDILCLQELKCVTEKFPAEVFGELGYQSAAWGQKTYNGVAILSKTTPKIRFQGMGWEFGGVPEAARLIAVEVAGIDVICVYCPNGQAVGSEKYTYKLEWYQQLRAFLNANFNPTRPLVVCGDFNVAPEDRDCYNPEAWRGQVLFSDPEKAALKAVCEFGLQDTFRKHHAEAGLYTWWDYRQLAFPKGRGLRIDFILATAGLYNRCVASTVDRNERKGASPSDHAPVIATFD